MDGMAKIITHCPPKLDSDTVQTLRCWVLLNQIVRKQIVIKAPEIIKARAKRKSA
jgi:hypothetical protein